MGYKVEELLCQDHAGDDTEHGYGPECPLCQASSTIAELEAERDQLREALQRVNASRDNADRMVAALITERDRLREAFVDVLDGGSSWWDVQAQTGMSEERCREIAALYAEQASRLPRR